VSSDSTPAVVVRVLTLREHSGARAHLRRAGWPATEQAAYPHLAGLWREHNRTAILAFATVAAEFYTVKHDPDIFFGRLMRHIAGDDRQEQQRMEQRLAVAQTQTLPALLVTVRHLLAVADERSLRVSYTDLYWLLCGWDSDDLERRNKVRRRLCDTYFSPDPATSTHPETVS
jgi:CRISPR type I-E-associated protein CasB/Cse2